MTDANIPAHVHGWIVVNEQPGERHHPVCAELTSNSGCSCCHPEFRMTPEWVRPAPVDLPCDEDLNEAS